MYLYLDLVYLLLLETLEQNDRLYSLWCIRFEEYVTYFWWYCLFGVTTLWDPGATYCDSFLFVTTSFIYLFIFPISLSEAQHQFCASRT